ncbi:amidohydrolase family protein [Pseudonocardia asaccharolytica]|uniref:4-oxalomesaconate hydratase n=1 Tax=Pseudonocardia asaccharolytica DSM 44247 = NBRC 16224 TaxID=1123024 RepID=A0A511CXE7_9PSEU|nr:amidohydrolase family protein [Pseudonocardia asaccharolytica]GEL17236.1 4-oxalomesaconate hydratase [Pseudonocardia asaccharolytica DSM 44247 = NBRC 16224]
MIIDSHGHLVAPPSFYGSWTYLEGAGRHHGRRHLEIDEAAHRAAADEHVRLLDAVGTDVQLVSPRPFVLKHSARPKEIVHWWVSHNNDAVAFEVKQHPDRFRGLAGLPQADGEPIESVFEELERCLDMGFVGVLLNPDPSEGRGTTPTLGDPYWYPLYEKLSASDVPALVHSAGCFGRENYSEHFISEESLAIGSLIEADVLGRFPDLKLIIPHGGGSIPYQLGRWTAHYARDARPGDRPYLDRLRDLWFDTCLYTQEALELLIKVVGHDRVLFGTERPGSGGHLDDLKPVVEAIEFLTQQQRNDLFEGNARTVYRRI